MWIFEVSVTIVFMTDLVLNFNTAFLADNYWVVSRQRIAANYLRGWFWIDMPSSIPVELIGLVLEDTGNLTMLRFLRMFRLLRMLRMLKVVEMVDRLTTAIEDRCAVRSPRQCPSFAIPLLYRAPHALAHRSLIHALTRQAPPPDSGPAGAPTQVRRQPAVSAHPQDAPLAHVPHPPPRLRLVRRLNDERSMGGRDVLAAGV